MTPTTAAAITKRIEQWAYTRDNDTMTLEIRFDDDTLVYVATLSGAETPVPQTSRFRTTEQFWASLAAFDRKMIGASWKVT